MNSTKKQFFIFSFIAIAFILLPSIAFANFDLTVNYDSSKGDVKVNGTTIASGTPPTSLAHSSASTVTITPSEGYSVSEVTKTHTPNNGTASTTTITYDGSPISVSAGNNDVVVLDVSFASVSTEPFCSTTGNTASTANALNIIESEEDGGEVEVCDETGGSSEDPQSVIKFKITPVSSVSTVELSNCLASDDSLLAETDFVLVELTGDNEYQVEFSTYNTSYSCDVNIVYGSTGDTSGCDVLDYSAASSGGSSSDGTSDGTSTSSCIVIDDIPIEAQTSGAPANLMFLLDDSNSIDYEITTGETDTIFNGHGYLYGLSDDYNGAQGDNVSTRTQDVLGGTNNASRENWMALWNGYNKTYYRPDITYKPWPATNGTDLMGNANKNLPAAHPTDDTYKMDLNMEYSTADSVSIPVSHFYIKSCTDSKVYLVTIEWDGDGDTDADYERSYYEVGVDTNLDDPLGVVTTLTPVASPPSSVGILNTIDTKRTDIEERQNFANWFKYYRRRQLLAANAIATVITETKDLNIGFAAADPLSKSNWGQASEGVIQPVLSVNDYLSDLLTELYKWRAGTSQAAGALRQGMEQIGLYFDTDDKKTDKGPGGVAVSDTWLGLSPITETCQQNFAVIFSDGSYSGLQATDSGNYDDIDPTGTPPTDYHYKTTKPGTTEEVSLTGVPPFAAKPGGNMADQVMKWYLKDLAPTIADEVPTDDIDYATWQHLVTYTIVFGDYGALDPEAVPTTTAGVTKPFSIFDDTTYPNNPGSGCGSYDEGDPWCWPAFSGNTDLNSVTDLWHAAVNGRGKFEYETDPQKLIDAIRAVVSHIKNRIGASGSAVSVTGDELVAGTYLFQTKYNSKGWAGDVYAYEIGNTANVWKASEVLESMVDSDGENDTWNTSTRNIATYNGSSGTAFSGSLTSLHSDLTADLVAYLRGDKTNEERYGGGYRDRLTEGDVSFTLGDIVHSSPVYHKDITYSDFSSGEGSIFYVGGNDGMMHAFIVEKDNDNAAWEGKELFAYVPKLVHGNLNELAAPGYSHKYFVDQSPFVRTIGSQTLLVGGLGKGGKGYYCLDVTNPEQNTQGTAGTWVKWEFPNSATSAADVADMGYSFSEAWFVKSQLKDSSDNNRWMLVFGNGYASPNENAVLFILDPSDGSVIKKIDTGAGNCNGLSTPAPTDIDFDGIIDFIYAGDLKGNMWKFDVSSSDVNDWGIAYSDGTDDQPLVSTGKAITTRPDVMRHCELHGRMVIFGTGQLLSTEDISASGNAIYGIWDFGDMPDYEASPVDPGDPTEYLGTFDPDATQTLSNLPSSVTLFEQKVQTVTMDAGNIIRVVGEPDKSPNWNVVGDEIYESTWGTYNTLGDPDHNENPLGEDTDGDGTVESAHAGWYFNLPTPNEKLILDVRIRSGLVYVVTSAHSDMGICSQFSGSSWAHAIDACTGGLPEKGVWDIDNSGSVDSGDFVDITLDDGSTVSVPGIGIKTPLVVGFTIVGDPDSPDDIVLFNFDDPDDAADADPSNGFTELDNVAGASGVGGAGTAPTAKAKFLYWRQID